MRVWLYCYRALAGILYLNSHTETGLEWNLNLTSRPAELSTIVNVYSDNACNHREAYTSLLRRAYVGGTGTASASLLGLSCCSTCACVDAEIGLAGVGSMGGISILILGGISMLIRGIEPTGALPSPLPSTSPWMERWSASVVTGAAAAGAAGLRFDVVGGDLAVTTGDEVGEDEPELRDAVVPMMPPPDVPALNETLLLLLFDAAESDRARFLFRILDKNFDAVPFSFSLPVDDVPASGPESMTRDEDASFPPAVELGVAVPDSFAPPRVWSCTFFW